MVPRFLESRTDAATRFGGCVATSIGAEESPQKMELFRSLAQDDRKARITLLSFRLRDQGRNQNECARCKSYKRSSGQRWASCTRSDAMRSGASSKGC